MKKLFKNRFNQALLAAYLVSILTIIYITNNIIKTEIEEYKEEKKVSLSEKIHSEMSTLILEKKDATLAMAISLASNDLFKNALINKDPSSISLEEISKEYKKNTVFKNIWIQIIDKEGKSFSRSWSDKRGDNLHSVREDVKIMFKNKKIRTTISVGKFSMSFKSMVPIFHKGEFLGIFEVISHFNSIEKKLTSKGYDSIVLTEKRYKKQLVNSISDTFIDGYYVANFQPNSYMLDSLKKQDLEELLLDKNPYHNYNKDKIFVVSNIFSNENKIIGYLIVLANDTISKTEISSIVILHILYGFLVILLISGIMFFLLDKKQLTSKISDYDYKLKATLVIAILFFSFLGFLYLFLEYEKKSKIEQFLKNTTEENTKIYNQFYDKFEDLASIIFQAKIDTPEVKQILLMEDKKQARQKLFSHMQNIYSMFGKYNLKQLHFHTPKSHSFLRMHRPQKYGDDLSDIRPTVVYVNKYKKKIDGFEEGAIYNGFRFVYPLFYNKKYLGSVEVSFSASYLIEELMENFEYKGGLFIQKNIVHKKLMQDEIKNYSQSTLEDFYVEKSIEKKSNINHTNFDFCKNNEKEIEQINKKAKGVEAFSFYLCNEEEITTFIPLVNPITLKSVGVIAVSKTVPYIKNKNENSLYTFLVLLFTSGIGLSFIYRELISKKETLLLNHELNNAQKIAKIGNWEFDLSINKLFWSNEVYSIFEVDKKKFNVTYENFLQIVHPEDRDMFNKTYNESLKNKEPYYSIEHRLLMRDGRVKYVKEDYETLFDSNNNEIKSSGTVQDITTQKLSQLELLKAKQEAQKANKAKSEFLANMSHEIRTPMNAIIGLGEILSDIVIGTKQKDILNKINNSSRILLSIINDILDYSKIEAGKFELEYHKFNIDSIVDKLNTIFEYKAKQKNIDFTIKKSKDLPLAIISDELRLMQVLNNLLSNAIKFTKQGYVTLNIDVLEKNEEDKTIKLKISVSDSGIGMSKEQVSKIFKPFTQADTSTTRQYGGTGLGLVISKNIVNAFGSQIEVHSKLGNGTTFAFEFDTTYSNQELKQKQNSKQDSISFKDIAILVVEDNEINQEVVKMMLEKTKVNVDIASNGQEGIDKFLANKDKYQVILMDLQMPIKSGYEATKEIRAYDKKIPIIALTAAAMIEDKQKAQNAGMNEHLGKPINKDKLYAIIGKYCKIAVKEKEDSKREEHKILNEEFLEEIVSSKDKKDAILKKFENQLKIGEFKDIVKSIENSEENAPELIHSLKGVSGNIGAKRLYEISKQIDSYYKRKEAIPKSSIDSLKEEIEKLKNKLETMDLNKTQKEQTKISKQELQMLLNRVKDSLKDSFVVDEKKLEQLLYNVENIVDKNEIKEFKKLVNEYEFDEALEIISRWKI